MKRILYLIFCSIISLSFISTTFAWYEVNSKIKNRIDGLMYVVEQQWWAESTIAQINRYEKIINSFSKIKLNGEQKEMIWYLLYLFQNKVNDLKENTFLQSDLIKNVDWEKVQETRLSWHNNERVKLWLNEYKLNENLNFSSLEWAKKLAKQNYSTHFRYWETKYTYSNILTRFNGLWIDFDYAGTAFTENISYNYYSCTKSDCTNEIITALKKWFNFFMSEKWKAYRPHYNALSSKVFTDMWFGVAVSWKKYWVVTHYGVNVK